MWVQLLTLVSLQAAPPAPMVTVELDRPEAPARQRNTFHVLVDTHGVAARIDFESAEIVREVVVVNAAGTIRGRITRVAASDSLRCGPHPLLLRLTTAPGSIGRFYLGTVRLRIGGVRFEEDLHVELRDDPAYAEEVIEHELLAYAGNLEASSANIGRSPDDPVFQDQLVACLAGKRFTLVLDPGHDPKDPRAATSAAGVAEVVFNDRLARRVKRRLAGIRNLDVILSRGRSQSLPLADRVRRIRSLAADLVLSIHHDSVRRSRQLQHIRAGKTLRSCDHHVGFSIYVPFESDHAELSYQLGRLLSSALLAAGRPVGRFFEWGEPQHGIYRGDALHLVRQLGRLVPVALLEVAFVCNPAEERLLGQRHFVDEQAQLIADAVLRYLVQVDCGGLRMASRWIAKPLFTDNARDSGSR